MRFTKMIVLLLFVGCSQKEITNSSSQKEIANSFGMKFRLIPAGEFMMGSSESPKELAEALSAPLLLFVREGPQHKVRITKPFFLGVTEVTQEQYETVMGKNPSWFSEAGRGADKVYGIDTSRFPVECVTWDDAVEFCKRLSATEGRTYRLPTEAEWEYACRAGGTTRYCFGDDPKQLPEYAWFRDNSDGRPHFVGQKEPNRWGLYDMHGNVHEWCQDFCSDAYPSGRVTDPRGPASGSSRVLRGGSWGYVAALCRSAQRGALDPKESALVYGFRLALSPSGDRPEAVQDK